MRIAFIGCVEFSAAALTMLLEHPHAELVGVVTRTESTINADFYNLTALGSRAGCPVFHSDNKDQRQMADWLRQQQPDVIYCLGWSELLAAEMLSIAPLGVVGYHPAALPQNRGRHPIIWALALGLKKTASTFFLMDKGADSGDILSQAPVTITTKDDAGSLYAKLINAALPQLQRLTTALASGTVRRVPQDHSQANYWRKRSVADGAIDWRMSAQSIHNLIRALARPYPGAHFEHDDRQIKVWHARLLKKGASNLEPGKVLRVTDEHIQVKCGNGSIELLEHELYPLPKEGSYL